MTKINFTKEHLEKMKGLAVDMLLKNESVATKMGQVLSVSDLLHTTTINTLNSIRAQISEKITKAEEKDEWAATEKDSKYLEMLKNQKELIHLIVGWKRYNMEQASIQSKKEALEERLEELRESQKTPAERIKELEEAINKLEDEQIC